MKVTDPAIKRGLRFEQDKDKIKMNKGDCRGDCKMLFFYFFFNKIGLSKI